MSVHFERALARTVGVEGDYSDNPDDSGGKTRFGITEVRARAHGYAGDMRELPWSLAVRIYEVDFWEVLKCEKIASMSALIADEVFDTGVNCGVGTAGMFLQRSLNALNRKQKDYPDIEVDGLVGNLTLHALSRFLSVRHLRGAKVLFRALDSLQGAYYIELAERREKDESFVFGWLLNRVDNEGAAS